MIVSILVHIVLDSLHVFLSAAYVFLERVRRSAKPSIDSGDCRSFLETQSRIRDLVSDTVVQVYP